jgi:peptide/nickel transport system ATP-binding protein
MIGKAVLGILPKAVEITSGQIMLDGVDLLALPPAQRRIKVGATCALIPQDPLTALNPSRRIGVQITDRLVDILGWTRQRAEERALALLGEVQITDPTRVLRQYPHELSGGMRQRILIASAFAAEPKLIVADEPTTALDVTVQKQILKLIAALQVRHGTALLFVTHDLGVVAEVADEVLVMYAGRVVERAPVHALFDMPQHPYTVGLLGAIPRLDLEQTRLVSIEGQVPSPAQPLAGCSFAPRCPFAQPACSNQVPALREVGNAHFSACLRAPLGADELLSGVVDEVSL